MHKEPTRRYASAEALAHDLQRYLDGEPVLARPDTLSYRLHKFIRRNRIGVGVAAAFVALLLGFSVVTGLQARAVAREGDAARAERDKAEQVVQVLVNLFETSNPTVVPGGDTLRVGDFLARGEAQVLEALGEQPAVQARMKQVLASVYSARSQFDRARALLDDALVQQEALTGADHPDALSMYHERALIARALGDPDAETLLRTSLKRQRAHYGSQHERVAQALHDLASVLDDWAEKERLLREALAVRRAVLPPVSSGIAASLNGLAVLHYSQNEVDQAIEVWQEALEILGQLHDEGHPHLLTVSQNLAAAHSRAGRFDEAERLLQQVLRQRQRVLGAETVPVGVTLSNLGVTLASQGRYAEAEDAFRDAVATWRAVFAKDHWRTANDLRNLGVVLQHRRRYEEGQAALEEAIAINRRLYGAASRQAGYVRGQLGILLLHRGQLEAAYREVEAALRLVGADAAASHRAAVADTRVRMGQVLLARGAAEAAEQHFREALTARRASLLPSDPRVLEARCGLAAALADRGAFEEAAMHLRQALPGYAAWGRADPWLLARARAARSTTSFPVTSRTE
jgi:serine/threonine-protein kinase